MTYCIAVYAILMGKLVQDDCMGRWTLIQCTRQVERLNREKETGPGLYMVYWCRRH